LRATLTQFLSLLGDVGSLPANALPDASQVPDGDIQLDAWVDNGKLIQLELDLIKLGELTTREEVPKGVNEVALRLGIDESSDEITAPVGAIVIDVQQILEGLFGGFGAGG
jgi:hypothetical protein